MIIRTYHIRKCLTRNEMYANLIYTQTEQHTLHTAECKSQEI